MVSAAIATRAEIRRRTRYPGNQRLERQRVLVARLERERHDDVARAKVLLDGLIQSQIYLESNIREF